MFQRNEKGFEMTNEAAHMNPEDFQPPTPAPDAALEIAEQLARKDAEIEAGIDRLKRLQAEFENYKKRIAREMSTLRDRVSDQEILDFLPLYDNVERAFTVYAKDRDVESFVSGVEQIFGQFAQVIEQKGVKRILAVGESYDPELHEALLTLQSEKPKHVILEEFSPGYARNGRTLQPSKVAVSQGPATGEEETK
jgi:molecular chaperone GrpE